MTDIAETNAQTLILVVDDNELNRELLIRRLEKRGFATAVASGGGEALDKIRTLPVDLVLLDINMPDMDGIQVLEAVRQTRDAVDLPIIMVSAHDESARIADAINKGANDYITKPIDFLVAMARINTQLSVKRAHKQLKESEERYALAFRGANDGLWDWDLGTGRIYFSDRWREMLGLGADELGDTPQSWFDRVHPGELENLKRAIENHLLGQSDALEFEYRALHKDGDFRWLLTRGVASRGADGQAVRLSGSQTDITRSKVYDPITSIPNKFLFMDRLEWLLDREKRSPMGSFAVFLIKIDRMGELRQSLGPVAGEDILIEMANRLMEGLRDEDTVTLINEAETFTVSRHDEGDFAILAEGCRDETSTPKLAERLHNMIKKPLTLRGENLLLTACIGIVANVGDDGNDAVTVMQHATNALDRARAKGPGNFELFDRDLQERALKRLKMETELRRAVADGGLHVNFQPIVHIDSGKVAGCEALARWTHAEYGQVSPVEFIPLAEESGLIDAIGEWILEEACRQHETWPNKDCIDLSVNLSLKQMQRDGVENRILSILERTGMDPHRLKIEITESIFMEDMGRINAILTTLHAQGIDIAIDDFGTGYSSLAYLNHLPITHLKIDRSFITDVSTDRAAQAIVQSTLLMAQSLGIKVIAEGIETEDQVALLKVLKAEYGQGFHYWRPLTDEDFAALL
ncbi:MAG: EAL domain-containing protein [Rhodospirillales bacterium]|nr:EAL domain-containing protein [Rhodospirillales bacterium]